MFNSDSESRNTLIAIHYQEQDLNRILSDVSKKRDYINGISADKASGIYNDYFNDLTNIQEECRTAYKNIINSNNKLTICKKLIIENINM